MKTIALHLATGFEEIEAVTIIDVLRRAALNVIVTSVTGNHLVTGAHEIQVKADKLFEEVNYELVDMIVLPGGMPGAANLDKHEGLRSQISNFYKNGMPIGAICAAPIVLGHMGLLQDKNVVCYPGYEQELKGAHIQKTPVQVDGTLVTGRGPGATLNFSLQIVEMLLSKKKADELAAAMLVETWK